MTGIQFTEFSIFAGSSAITLKKDNASASDPFVMKGIDGLGPTTVDVAKGQRYPYGSVLQNRRPQDRQLIVRIGLNPDYGASQSAADLRDTLYRMFSSTSDDFLHFVIKNGATSLMSTYGWMSDCVIVPFAKDPEVQVTIETNSPYFVDANTVSLSGLTANDISFDNPGTAQSGFTFQLTLGGALASWNLMDVNSGKKFKINYGFASGDVVTICTIPGQMDANVLTGSTTISLLPYLDSTTEWLQIGPGANAWRSSSSPFAAGSMVYTPLYLGV